MSKLDTLARFLSEARRAVFFGGAGVSTESGIPDFRSPGGLYSEAPETIVSHSFFYAHPEEFYRFYRERMLYPEAEPGPAHLALAALERMGHLRAVVTQNIDGLHQRAGSRLVLELHGSVHRNHCVRCGRQYPLQAVLESEGLPRCACGGLIRPDVVLYEEPLPAGVFERAEALVRGADLLLVGGSSLTVYPAAGLLQYYRGSRLVLLNRTPTPADGRADLVLRGSIGAVLSAAVARL